MDIVLEEKENIELLNKLISAAEMGLLKLAFEKCLANEFVFDYKGHRGRITESGIFKLCNAQDELALYKQSSSQTISALMDRLYVIMLIIHSATSQARCDAFRESIKDF